MRRDDKKKENREKNYSKLHLGFFNICNLIIIVVLCIVAGFMIYFIYFSNPSCEDIGCYKEALLKCKKVFFVREDNNSVWRYDILGSEDSESCNVQVRLLKLIRGDVSHETLYDKSMVCLVYKEGDYFPEKDMSRCHGVLREEFQQIIIDEMHAYLLQNIGEIREEFKGV